MRLSTIANAALLSAAGVEAAIQVTWTDESVLLMPLKPRRC